VLSAILTLGIGREKLLISLDRNAAVAVDIVAAKPQIEMAPIVIVRDRSQHPRLHSYPIHNPDPMDLFSQVDQPEQYRPHCHAHPSTLTQARRKLRALQADRVRNLHRAGISKAEFAR